MIPIIKPTFIPLDDIYFEIERIEDKEIFEAENISISLNDEDNQYYLYFDIGSSVCNVGLPISYLKENEEGIRYYEPDSIYSGQHTYSESFHNELDYSAANFQALGVRYQIFDVFSISMYVHEKLKESSFNI